MEATDRYPVGGRRVHGAFWRRQGQILGALTPPRGGTPRFLDDCEDVITFAKNYMAVGFKLDYVHATGDIPNYYPDFMVKLTAKEIFIVETKGQFDLDVPLKMVQLKQWCEDINRIQSKVKYDFVYVDMEGFEKYRPSSFRELVKGFVEYR